jgi:hypothetical protein
MWIIVAHAEPADKRRESRGSGVGGKIDLVALPTDTRLVAKFRSAAPAADTQPTHITVLRLKTTGAITTHRGFGGIRRRFRWRLRPSPALAWFSSGSSSHFTVSACAYGGLVRQG